MKIQLLTSAAAMAVLRAASAAASYDKVVSSVGTDRRSLTGISFSQQVEDAIEVFKEEDEGGSKKEQKMSNVSDGNSRNQKGKKHDRLTDSNSNRSSRSSSSISGDRKSHSSDVRFTEGMCDPDETKHEHMDICEDIWETMCNPDDEIGVDDEYCDWLGFTVDVDWVDDGDFDYEMVYKKTDDEGSEKKVKTSISSKSSWSQSSSSASSSGDHKSLKHSRDIWFTEGMCDPDKTKSEHEDICQDIWDTMCNPDDEIRVDDEYCDWLGFTADLEWYGNEDFFYEMEDSVDSYHSNDRFRKNLRG